MSNFTMPDHLIDKLTDNLRIANKRIAALEAAGRYILPYLTWTIGPESPGYHPTMPSAVSAFIAVLENKED